MRTSRPASAPTTRLSLSRRRWRTAAWGCGCRSARPRPRATLATGYQADILVLEDLKTFRPRSVLKRGAAPKFVKLEAPEWVRQTVSLAPVDASSFHVPSGPKNIRVMRVIPAQLITGVETVEP